jgi:beta-N-acetylhexosaminidase
VIDGLLRGELGYDGAIVSDDLEMRAVADRWGVAQAAVMAIEAGCDALLVCSSLERIVAARDALAARARADEAFAARLQEAAARIDRLPRIEAPAPDVLERIAAAGGDAIEREIGARAGGARATGGDPTER